MTIASVFMYFILEKINFKTIILIYSKFNYTNTFSENEKIFNRLAKVKLSDLIDEFIVEANKFKLKSSLTWYNR